MRVLELVLGVVLSLASWAGTALCPPAHRLAPFPIEAIEELCGQAGHYRTLPSAELPGLLVELRVLDDEALVRRICDARTREEVAYGLAALGSNRADEDLLHVAADHYANPLAMAALGRLAYRARDDAEAWRYLAAASAVAREPDGPVPAACAELARRPSDRLADRFDPAAYGPSTDRFVAQRVALHQALYR